MRRQGSPEDVMVEALNFGHQAIQPLIDIQEQMAREIGKPKQYLSTLHTGRSHSGTRSTSEPPLG